MVESLMEQSAMDYLAGLASHIPADHCIVEIGTYQAANLCSMAHGAKNGLGAICYGIDPYGTRGLDIYRGRPHMLKRYTSADHTLAKRNIRTQQLTHHAKILVSTSVTTASSWTGPPIGLLVIDGEHREHAVLQDFHSWRPHLAPGAIIAFDDYEPSRVGAGVIKAVDQLVESSQLHNGRLIGTRLYVTRI